MVSLLALLEDSASTKTLMNMNKILSLLLLTTLSCFGDVSEFTNIGGNTNSSGGGNTVNGLTNGSQNVIFGNGTTSPNGNVLTVLPNINSSNVFQLNMLGTGIPSFYVDAVGNTTANGDNITNINFTTGLANPPVLTTLTNGSGVQLSTTTNVNGNVTNVTITLNLTNIPAAQLTGTVPPANLSGIGCTNLIAVTWAAGGTGPQTNQLLMYEGPTISNMVQVACNFSDPNFQLLDVTHAHWNNQYYLYWDAQNSCFLGCAVSPDDFSWVFQGYMGLTNEFGNAVGTNCATGPKLMVDSTNGLDALACLATNAASGNLFSLYACHVNPFSPTNIYSLTKLNLTFDTNQSADNVGGAWWYFPERSPCPYYLITAQGNEYNATNPFSIWNFVTNVNNNAGVSASSPVVVRQGTNYCLAWLLGGSLSFVSYSSDMTNWGSVFQWSANGYTPGTGNTLGDGTILQEYRTFTQPNPNFSGTNYTGGFVGRFYGNGSGLMNVLNGTNTINGTVAITNNLTVSNTFTVGLGGTAGGGTLLGYSFGFQIQANSGNALQVKASDASHLVVLSDYNGGTLFSCGAAQRPVTALYGYIAATNVVGTGMAIDSSDWRPTNLFRAWTGTKTNWVLWVNAGIRMWSATNVNAGGWIDVPQNP